MEFTQDDMNKLESVVGYLQPLFDDLDVLKRTGSWHFMPGLIDEAEDWLKELHNRANTTAKSELAHTN